MVKSIVISWILVMCGFVQALANVPDISLNYISKAACRVSAGPNRGSGVAVSMDATNIYVLTNAHVVESYTQVTVEFYRYGAKTNPLNSTVYSKILTQDKDFAILSVPRSSFGKKLPEIVPLVPPTYQLKPNTYFATAGHPFSRDMTSREGLITGEEGSRIIFTPPPDSGQSGSGMFVRIGDKVYVVGIITFKSGDYTMDLNGNPKTWGAGFHVNRLRSNLNATSEYNGILYPVVETLYALGSDGKYYPQDGEGGATVPLGVQIVQWNCPSGTCKPQQPQQPRMVPLPRPIVPQPKPQLPNPSTTAPPANNNGPFQNLPDGFDEEPTPNEPVPNEPTPDVPLPEVPEVTPPVDPAIATLKAEIDILKLKLIEKESKIMTLELTLKEQAANSPALEECKKEAALLKLTIEQKNTEISKLQLDINMLKEFLNKPPVTEPEVVPPVVVEPEITQPVTPTEPNEISQVAIAEDKISTWDSVKRTGKKLTPLWLVLAGVGGTLLLGKYKAIAAVPGLIGGLFAKKKKVAVVVEQVAKTAPEMAELIKWLNQRFNTHDDKLNGVTDYVTSKLDDISNSTVVNNNINVDAAVDADGLDYRKLFQEKPASDRVKQFFDLKKKDGDSIEKWAFFALLYKEAMQLLRKGYFEIDITGSKVPLQGQKLAADKIDSWVRDEFLKRTTIDKLDYNHLYHEAMIGFLYKEAVRLLRIGQFPVLGAKETANVIENWVKREFLERMGITL